MTNEAWVDGEPKERKMEIACEKKKRARVEIKI